MNTRITDDDIFPKKTLSYHLLNGQEALHLIEQNGKPIDIAGLTRLVATLNANHKN